MIIFYHYLPQRAMAEHNGGRDPSNYTSRVLKNKLRTCFQVHASLP